jgi:hypothetical protein
MTPMPTPTPTPTPVPSGGIPTCGPCTTPSGGLTCCQAQIPPFCGKVFLDCGVQFNNTEYVFGLCAIRVINELASSDTVRGLQHLINIINIDTVTSLTSQTFQLPAPGTVIDNNCNKLWQCGQVIYVSNVSRMISVNIVPPAGQLINCTVNTIILEPFFAGPPISQSGALFILAPADPAHPEGNCIWYTLNI